MVTLLTFSIFWALTQYICDIVSKMYKKNYLLLIKLNYVDFIKGGIIDTPPIYINTPLFNFIFKINNITMLLYDTF